MFPSLFTLSSPLVLHPGSSPGVSFKCLGGVKVCGLILLKGKPQGCVNVSWAFHNKHNMKHSQNEFLLSFLPCLIEVQT